MFVYLTIIRFDWCFIIFCLMWSFWWMILKAWQWNMSGCIWRWEKHKKGGWI